MPNSEPKNILPLVAVLIVASLCAGIGWWLFMSPEEAQVREPLQRLNVEVAQTTPPEDPPSGTPIQTAPPPSGAQRSDLPTHRGPESKSQTAGFKIQPPSTRKVKASLAGFVLRPDGSPVEGATVGLLTPSEKLGKTNDKGHYPFRITKESGAFLLPSVFSVRSRISARRERPGEFLIAPPQDLLPKPAEAIGGIKVILGAGPRIEGKVIDALTLKPLNKVRVSIQDLSRPRIGYQLTTSSSGRFLFAGIQDASYKVSVVASSYQAPDSDAAMAVPAKKTNATPLLIALKRKPQTKFANIRIDFDYAAKPEANSGPANSAGWRVLQAGHQVAEGVTSLTSGTNTILGALNVPIETDATLQLELISGLGRLSAPLKQIEKLHFAATGHAWHQGAVLSGQAKNAMRLVMAKWAKDGILFANNFDPNDTSFRADVRVRLHLGNGQNQTPPTSASPPYQVTYLDEFGGFLFDQVPPGKYWLTAKCDNGAMCFMDDEGYLEAIPISMRESDQKLATIEIFRGSSKSASHMLPLDRTKK